MKKVILSFLSCMLIFILISCKEKESIDTPKEFQTGDIVEYNGVIYDYMDIFEDITTLSGNAALEYVFEEEENYKSFYCVYYLDMSEYKNQPKLREDQMILECSSLAVLGENDFDRRNNPKYSPIDPYAFFVPSYLDWGSEFPEIVRGSFIVKGYTEELPEDVIIPQTIHGKYVGQIGYKAFLNAPMRSLEWKGKGYVHPYAISNCNQLETITFTRGLVMSMGISNCSSLKTICEMSPTMDCSLYNLSSLELNDKFSFHYSHNSWFNHHTAYGMGGLRKSFFYNCPALEEITGRYIEKAFNTIYYSASQVAPIPIFVLKNYTVIVTDYLYYKIEDYNGTLLYNPDTLEAYVPFLNDGLEKEGVIMFKNSSGENTVMENEKGIYVHAVYSDPKYNATLLLKRN